MERKHEMIDELQARCEEQQQAIVALSANLDAILACICEELGEDIGEDAVRISFAADRLTCALERRSVSARLTGEGRYEITATLR